MMCNLFVGTGTSIEVNSLGTFFSQYHKETAPPVLLGSVKTNIDHTESAAGEAGLIKVLLMMKHGQIVPSLHVKKDKSNLNLKISLDKYGFDIALEFQNGIQITRVIGSYARIPLVSEDLTVMLLSSRITGSRLPCKFMKIWAQRPKPKRTKSTGKRLNCKASVKESII